MNPTKDFGIDGFSGISHLIMINSLIKRFASDNDFRPEDYTLNARDSLDIISEYSEWLHETKLTAAMFQEGGLFKGFTEVTDNDMYRKYSNGSVTICFGFIGDSNACAVLDRYKHYNHIQTLADLARLTKDKPIPFR
jgi:hypothetical protein